MVGRTVAQYRVLEKLGAGGMGEIYKALDTRLNRQVAIKVLTLANSGDPERRRRFIQEAQSASGLNHPNIITIHDIVPDGGEDFMVMEYVSGQTLGNLIPPGGLGPGEVLRIAVQIADGLAAAHAAGIVHRDLKPGNIMVTEPGRVKLLDFGLAKLSPAAAAAPFSDATATLGAAPLTVEGSILGTVSYMSPEQAQGKPVDARSDIFAFGLLLYEMCTGRRAFQEDSMISTLSAILRDEPRPMAEIASEVPAELDRVIYRALRKAPSDRWQSMTEIHAKLVELKQKSDSGTLVLPAAAIPVARRTPTAAWAALALVLVAGVGGGAWFWMGRKAPVVAPPVASVAPLVAERRVEPPPPAAAPPAPAVKTPVVLEAPVTKRAADAPPRPAGLIRAVQITSGIPFEITLAEDIPAVPEPGRRLRFAVSKDVSFNDTVIVSKGAIVTGEVAGQKKGFLGRSSKPAFRLIEVVAVDGTSLKLRATPTRRSDGKIEQPIEGAGRPRTKEALALAGAAFVAYFDTEATVTVKRPAP